MTSTIDFRSDDPRLPEGAGPPQLIVGERSGRWAVAIRRQWPGDLPMHETGSVPECWRMLASSPAAFVVVELTRSNADGLLDQLGRLERDFPLARVAVVADRALADCEWLVREAGAVCFATSLREARGLADVAVRHLRAAPRAPQALAEKIWSALPWK